MTWQKLGTEYADECAAAGLSDAAFRTHTEAIGWLYRIESDDLRIPRRLLRRFAGSPGYEQAARELAACGFWAEEPGGWVVRHHAEVIRQSIAAQIAHREQAAARKRRQRAKPDVTQAVTREVTRSTVRQTGMQAVSNDASHRESERGTCIACDRPARNGCRTCWEHASRELAAAG